MGWLEITVDDETNYWKVAKIGEKKQQKFAFDLSNCTQRVGKVCLSLSGPSVSLYNVP